MILQIGLLLATYIGAELYEAFTSEPDREAEPFDEPPETLSEDLIEEQNKAISALEERNARQELYARVSALSMGALAVRRFFPIAGIIGLGAYLFSVRPYMKDVERSLFRERRVNVDVLFFFGDVLTLGTGSYFTAAFGLYLIHAGKVTVAKAKDESEKIVSHLFRELPQKVWVLVDGVETEIPLDEVKTNDLLALRSGEVISVDGVIVEGAATVDQQALTGEAMPVDKGDGDVVFANTIVIAGRLVVRVEKSGMETTSNQIAHLLFSSTSFKSSVQLKGEKWADMMTLPMFLCAIVALPVIGARSTAVFINGHMGVRIRFLAPLETLAHISYASKMGILVKDGRALENLHEIDTVLFDKTGTLTTQQPEVIRIITCGAHQEREVLSYAATAEQKLGHPIAKAVIKKAQEEGVKFHEVHDSEYNLGYGIGVRVEGMLIRVGSVRFLKKQGLAIPKKIEKLQRESHQAGNMLILVGLNSRVAGAIELQPQIRPETRSVIRELREFGIQHVGIVSGDHQGPTERLAKDLGVDDYFFDVLPEEKARIVEKLQREGRSVCFVGDGINDSIALKTANISVSLAGASTIAKDMAEIIFIEGNLTSLCQLFELSQKLDRSLHRGLKLSLVPAVVNVAGALVFNFGILTSLLVNVGVGSLAMINANLLMRKSPKRQLALEVDSSTPSKELTVSGEWQDEVTTEQAQHAIPK